MSKRLAVSRAAQSDINDIYDYTLETWGRSQADDYVMQLENSLTAAAAGEKTVLSFAEWQPNAGYMFVGKHTVFVLHEAEQLLVVRVLHQSSDYVRHLSSS